MNGAAFLGIDVDASRIQRRVDSGYCDRISFSLDEALDLVASACDDRRALSVGLVGNAAEIIPALADRDFVPDVLTDQTSAHDLKRGYIPIGHSPDTAAAAQNADPDGYESAVLDSMVAHVEGMLSLQARGARTFDYGNNIRGQVADRRGLADAFKIPGFVPEFIRPPVLPRFWTLPMGCAVRRPRGYLRHR